MQHKPLRTRARCKQLANYALVRALMSPTMTMTQFWGRAFSRFELLSN